MSNECDQCHHEPKCRRRLAVCEKCHLPWNTVNGICGQVTLVPDKDVFRKLYYNHYGIILDDPAIDKIIIDVSDELYHTQNRPAPVYEVLCDMLQSADKQVVCMSTKYVIKD